MSAPRTDEPRACILGLAGLMVLEAERALFREADPLGFILFARNVREPEQVGALVAELRGIVGRSDAPVLIDQEGGRVQRLGPPHWHAAPAAMRCAELAGRDPLAGPQAAWLNARLIAHDLHALGISVNCAPVLDVPAPGSHAVIGDRAAGDTPQRAAQLGFAACEGFLAGGVLPVIKHIPGHGRARVDSHLELPVVDASEEDLNRMDFAPFRALRDMPWAMTAHVVYTAIDPDAPATTSPTVIADIIRGRIAFDGVLISDDLSMQALKGSLADRAAAARDAGCDLLLHCNGDMTEMQQVVSEAPALSGAALERVQRAEARRLPPERFDADAERARLHEMLGNP